MIKTFSTLVLAAVSSVAFAEQAQACHRGCCATACAPQACSAAPADPHAGMQMSQAPGARTYQSFSYEPGAAPAPMATGRMMTPRSSGWAAPYLRADNKAAGRYQWDAR